MKLSEDWPRLLFVEIVILFISFFAVNLLVDFVSFSGHPAAHVPTPYFPHVFEDNAPTNSFFIKKYWAQVLFFLLVFFGQIAIFRLRKNIFILNPKQNG